MNVAPFNGEPVEPLLATAEQVKAIAGAVGGGRKLKGALLFFECEEDGGGVAAAVRRIERKLDVVAERTEAAGRAGVLSDKTAEQIFELMRRLETDPKKKKAQLLTVFRITVLDGRTQREAAAICECKESLVSRRVAELEERFGMSVEQLRYYASKVLDLESAAKGGRSRKKKQGARPDADEAEPAEGDDFGGGEEEV
ncbi:MAG TPA: hypothetical protein P5205_09365 [Candidatus Paceibacterota bacterium]|nr:hypothetical protein [Verrucomicrobiota bacterium]HSA10565.1 hypothetical protein [Candidatus Paceibacterota bacterium]